MESLDTIDEMIDALTCDMLKSGSRNENKLIELLELRNFIIERDEAFRLLFDCDQEKERIRSTIDIFLSIVGSDITIKNDKVIELETFGTIFDRMHDAISLIPKSIIAYRNINRSKPRSIVFYFNKLLITVAAKIVPVYKNKTAETRGTPMHYLLKWTVPAAESY